MTRLRLMIVSLGLMVASGANAIPHRWQLHQVAFDDGGTASGWIEIESTTGALLDFHIRVTGGDPINFPNSSYSADTGVTGIRLQINAHPVDSFEFSGGDGDLQRVLRLTPGSNLESAIGESAIDTGFPSGNLECQDCSPLRLIVSGSFHDVLHDDGFEGDSGGGGGGGGDGDG